MRLLENFLNLFRTREQKIAAEVKSIIAKVDADIAAAKTLISDDEKKAMTAISKIVNPVVAGVETFIPIIKKDK